MNIPYRKIVMLVILLIVVLVFGKLFFDNLSNIKTRASYSEPVLSIIPSSTTVNVGSTVSLSITLNTNGSTVSATELHFSYDPTAVQLLSFTPADSLPVVLQPLDDSTVVLGSKPENPLKISGVIGTLNVKVIARGQSIITFSKSTQVAVLGKTTNALANLTGATIIGTDNVSDPLITPTPTKTGSRCGETDCLKICKKIGSECSTQDFIKNKCLGKYSLKMCTRPPIIDSIRIQSK